MHRTICETNECGVLLSNFSRFRVGIRDNFGRVCVLLFRNIEVVVDKELTEGNFLLVYLAYEFVVDRAPIYVVDNRLVFFAAEGEMVDLVSKINLISGLHKSHHDIRAVVRR